jgi:F-type H+-transporting ATPase subunit alpha
MTDERQELQSVLAETLSVLDQVSATHRPGLRTQEVGRVRSVGSGIALVSGLPGVEAEELIRFPGGLLGLAFNVDPTEVGVVLLGEIGELKAGAEARLTGRVLDVPVGEGLLGRVVDPLGRPLDNQAPIRTLERRPVEREAPPIMARAPVTVPLQTGLKVVDALVPIGRGQRELILGDRQTGKTAIVIDTLINQRDQGVICVYCAIGQRDTAVAKLIADLKEQEVMDYCIVVVALGEALPGLHFVAPYAATSMAEYFMQQGRDVLIIYDNLSNHAHSYRELSLLLRRPPGREAYPGDIFYIHSRLLERSTHLRPEHGGGSLTALPIVETQAQNIAAYIPTNLISITDGQIYLTPGLFQKGIFPAVDVGKSVSRVGGKAQLPAYRAVAGDLRLSYSQFQELEAFSRFGTRLDERTRKTLEHGYRVREVLKQSQFDPMAVAAQIGVLLAVTQGLFDDIPLEKVAAAEKAVRKMLCEQLPELCRRIEDGEDFPDADRKLLLSKVTAVIQSLS